jgi:hypothetical protein
MERGTDPYVSSMGSRPHGRDVTTTIPSLAWSRDGALLAVAESDHVSIQQLRGSQRIARVRAGTVRGVVAFDDQVWIAERTATGAVQLRRLDPDGRLLGVPRRLDGSGGAGGLAPIPLGAPAARWGWGAIVDDLGVLRAMPAPVADLTIPVTARRWITVHDGRLGLGNGLEVAAPLPDIERGAVLCDGAFVALVDAGRALVVVARATGDVVARGELPAGAVGFAARRGLAVVTVDPRAAEVIDLRTGRPLGVIATDRDVTELALDPDGRTVALGYGHAGVEVLPLDAALGRRLVLALGPAPPGRDAAEYVVVEPIAAPLPRAVYS